MANLPDSWPTWLAFVLLFVDVAVSLHVVLHKRDTRAAISWVGLIWLAPLVGVVMYGLFGLNRIRRQGADLQRARLVVSRATADSPDWLSPQPDARLAGLALLTERLSKRPLLGGNSIAPVQNGDEAYPAMLAAIDGARRSVALCSYIFAGDRAGMQFVEALTRATQRGVQVRVLVDDVGSRYTWPRATRALKRAGVPVAHFLPMLSRSGIAFFNLRTHRKALIVDGEVAFTGGMNIQAPNVWALANKSGKDRRIRDTHFRVRGPVIQQLLDTFAEDWAFVTREVLDGPAWHAPVENRGTIAARVIASGPDRDFETVRHALLGAVASARESVSIVTPYFLPDAPMIAALSVAALRGVRVDIVLPARGNIPVADWATRALLWQLLKPGCCVHLTPAPFDHTKLMVIDRSWTLLGTTNWDPRSLRLNFELDVECYDERFANDVQALIDERIAASRAFTLADADGRPFVARVRDGIARLLSPYL